MKLCFWGNDDDFSLKNYLVDQFHYNRGGLPYNSKERFKTQTPSGVEKRTHILIVPFMSD